MKITWLGHSGFRIEIAGQVLLVDPWLRGNPMFDEARFDEAIEGVTHLLVSHGHFDHAANAVEISKAKGVPIGGVFELANALGEEAGVEAAAFGLGGTIAIGDVSVTLVGARHSSSTASGYSGTEAGFMISGEGKTIYFSGDTDVTADMGVYQALHAPQIGILCVGGHFTMDQRRAAYACKTFFDFETVIPCHYKTFPLLAQDAEELKSEIGADKVREPEVMVPIEI
ncbi:MAG: metal-dependent hydrolase [Pseudomonadota bacterium]